MRVALAGSDMVSANVYSPMPFNWLLARVRWLALMRESAHGWGSMAASISPSDNIL